MKSITEYVDQRRLHDLIRELENVGVTEIHVIEYFSQPARISRIRLVCLDNLVENIRALITSTARTGTACDQCLRVTDVAFRATRGAISGENHVQIDYLASLRLLLSSLLSLPLEDVLLPVKPCAAPL